MKINFKNTNKLNAFLSFTLKVKLQTDEVSPTISLKVRNFDCYDQILGFKN